MNNTFVFDFDSKNEITNLVKGHTEWPLFKEVLESPFDFIYGDGGVITNTDDFYKWVQFLQNPYLIPNKKCSDKIFTSGKLRDNQEVFYSYGFSLSKWNDGSLLIQHSGSWQGYKSYMCNIPVKGIWAYCFSNSNGINPMELTFNLIESFKM